MTLWLTPVELVELTGYKTAKRQKGALGKMGVKFLSRQRDGFPLVDRAIFAKSPELTPQRKKREPAWEALS